MPNFLLEQQIDDIVVGLDEAGCGPWAGPVVAGAVIFKNYTAISTDLLQLLDDSKKISAKRRQQAYDLLYKLNGKELYLTHGITSEQEIDTINIRKAAMLAMQRAVTKLPIQPSFALIDGITKPDLVIPCKTITKGDGISFSIAASSIIAKVTRDNIMQKLAIQYPEYGWDRNAGYGTKEHQMAIASYGITKHHRKSFAPIKKYIQGL